jgi:50S ribosomal subunit-associated GTPase HflX
MMNITNSQEYFDAKLGMLSELLSCSEEIMSIRNQDKWEDYERLGNKRVEVIERINALEDAHRLIFDKELSPQQRQQINEKVNLIQAFDKDVVKRIYEEREIALRGMETDHNERNILGGYKIGSAQTTGVYLDTKK